MTAGSTGFASGGVTRKPGALCFYSGLVLIDSFCAPKPARVRNPNPLAGIAT